MTKTEVLNGLLMLAVECNRLHDRVDIEVVDLLHYDFKQPAIRISEEDFVREFSGSTVTRIVDADESFHWVYLRADRSGVAIYTMIWRLDSDVVGATTVMCDDSSIAGRGECEVDSEQL